MDNFHFNKFIGNYFYLLLSQAIAYISNFGIALVLARKMDISHFGEFFLLLTIQSFFLLIADSGLNSFYLRCVSQDNSLINKYLNNIIPLKISLFLGSYLLMQAFVLIFGYSSQVVKLSYIFGLSLMPFSLNSLISFTFRAIGRMDRELVSNVISGIMVALYVIWLSFVRADIFEAVLMWVMLHTLSLLFNLYLLRRTLAIRLKVDFSQWGLLLSESKYFLLFFLTSWCYIQANTIIISRYLPVSEVGLYQSALKILMVSVMLGDVMLNNFFPFIIRKYFESPEEGKLLISKISELVMSLVWPILLIEIFFSKEIIAILYGNQFEKAVVPLVILGIGYLFYYAPPYGLLLAYIGHQKTNFYIALGSAFVNIILNFHLIPRNGIVGAATATALTYAGMKIAYMLVFAMAGLPLYSLGIARLTIIMLSLAVIVRQLHVHFMYGLSLYFLLIGIYTYKKYFTNGYFDYHYQYQEGK